MTPLLVLIAPHSHNDVGWKRTMAEYFESDVRAILDQVVRALLCEPRLRFSWADVAFLHRWWAERRDERIDLKCDGDVDIDDWGTYGEAVRHLVHSGRLDLLHGAFVQHDEAATSLYAALTQITLGHRWLAAHVLGAAQRVRTAFQIDPFGHAAALPGLFLMAGHTRLVINRIDFVEKRRRARLRRLEFRWFSAPEGAALFVHTLRHHYSKPPDQSTDGLRRYVADELAPAYRSPDTRLLIWGDDFRFGNKWEFEILNTTVAAFNAGLDRPAMEVATISRYLDAAEPHVGDDDVESGLDFFPYREAYIDVWTGFFSSRPALKTAIRDAERWLRAAELFDREPEALLDEARQHVAVLHHHDAITGTCTQHVADDYMRMARDAKSAAQQLLGAAPLDTERGFAAPLTFAVVNTLPWRRVELVQLKVDVGGAVQLDAPLACQTVPLCSESSLLLALVELAPFETRRFTVRASHADAAGACQVTPFEAATGGDYACHNGVCAQLSATRYFSKYMVPLSSGAYVFRTDLRLPLLFGVTAGALVLLLLLAIGPLWRAAVCRWRRDAPSRALLWPAALLAALAVPRLFWLGDGASAASLPSAVLDVVLMNDVVSVAVATTTCGFVLAMLLGVHGRWVVPAGALLSVLYLALLMHTHGAALGAHVPWLPRSRVASGRVAVVRELLLSDDNSSVRLVERRDAADVVDAAFRFAPLPANSELMVRAEPSFGVRSFATDDQVGLVQREPFTWHWLQPLSMAFKPLISAAELAGERAEQQLTILTRRACGAALLGNAFELHVGRRLLTDDEKGLRSGLDDVDPVPVDVRLLFGVAEPLARARHNVLFEQPPLVLADGDAVAWTRPALNAEQWPPWAHLVLYRALRDNATLPVADDAAAAGALWHLLHVQNIDAEPHAARVDELVAWSGGARCVVTTSTGLEARGAPCSAARLLQLRPRQMGGHSFYTKPHNFTRIRGHLSYSLSPYAQKPFAKMLSVPYNMQRFQQKLDDNLWVLGPPFATLLLTFWGIKKLEDHLDRKAWF